MAKVWAALSVALCAMSPLSSRAQPGPANAAMAVLCEDYRSVEQSALGGFIDVAGKSPKVNPLVALVPDLLAPRFSGAKLMLPDAEECDLRPSKLRRGHTAYFCFWKSDQPDMAATDQARRIAACLNSQTTKSDFSADLVVVTPAKVRFTLASQHTYDHYGVRLMVDGPQS
ncbi:MAG TPA: hypothetical protein VG960_06635 [Caulobacteraceae bacterium]|nr:hypothetical protein [Caulobacteraceae bacterium]